MHRAFPPSLVSPWVCFRWIPSENAFDIGTHFSCLACVLGRAICDRDTPGILKNHNSKKMNKQSTRGVVLCDSTFSKSENLLHKQHLGNFFAPPLRGNAGEHDSHSRVLGPQRPSPACSSRCLCMHHWQLLLCECGLYLACTGGGTPSQTSRLSFPALRVFF